MKVELVDPRDQTLQVADPAYRVYFWTEGGSAKEEWELSGRRGVPDSSAGYGLGFRLS
jgi:hypothetical protein